VAARRSPAELVTDRRKAASPATEAPPLGATEPAIIATAHPDDAALPPVPGSGVATSAPAPATMPIAATLVTQPGSLPPPPLLPPTPIIVLPVVPATLARDIGLAMARRIGRDGDELRIRLEPADFGTVDVRLSFDDRGSLRAVVGADSTLALDLLRRDAAELGRALTDAGVRADDRSFRFENRSEGQPGSQHNNQADARGQRGDGQPQGRAPSRAVAALPDPETADAAALHPLAWRGGVDVIA
jgi:flagellar hook-length control protein FliK